MLQQIVMWEIGAQYLMKCLIPEVLAVEREKATNGSNYTSQTGKRLELFFYMTQYFRDLATDNIQPPLIWWKYNFTCKPFASLTMDWDILLHSSRLTSLPYSIKLESTTTLGTGKVQLSTDTSERMKFHAKYYYQE